MWHHILYKSLFYLRSYNSYCLLWFESGMSPKGSCVEGLVPNAVVSRGAAFGEQLDYEGSDLINGIIHWWIHNLMTLGGGGN
jgi:hypothetical protein